MTVSNIESDSPIDRDRYFGYSDETLAQLCKERDPLAFQELTKRHIQPILHFARTYVLDEDVAEDITQDTFFKIWKNIRQYKEGMRFKPWLYKIARNTSLDYKKKRKAIVFSDLDDNDNDIAFVDTLKDGGPTAEEVLDNAISARVLVKALKKLSTDQRIVIILHYREGLTFEEIATILDKPMNTVKSWHHRALIGLRKLLKDDKSI